MQNFRAAVLLALASIVVAPLAQAKGTFFIDGQGGRADLHDVEFEDSSTNLRSLGLGYRWQAGRIFQIGVEVGGGKLGELSQEYTEDFFDGYLSVRETLESSYAYIGANSRIQFGAESRWFAVVRLGYMGYDEKWKYNYNGYYAFDDSTFSGSESESDSGGGAYFGAGIGFNITPNFNVYLTHNGYAYTTSFDDDEYDSDDLYSASSTNLGLELNF